MKSLFSRSLAAVTAGVFALTLGACGGSTSENSSGSTGDKLTELIVGASPVPHAKILKYLENPGEAKEVGLKLNVKDFNDYVLLNEVLAGGDINANYYQTVSYLGNQSKPRGYKSTAGRGIHLKPLAIFSKKIKSFREVKDGATISIINGPANRGHSLALLATNGLLKLKRTDASVLRIKGDSEANPHDFKFHEADGPPLVTSPPDVNPSVINGNFYQSAGLKSSKVLAIGSPKDNPAANILTWRADEKSKSEAIRKLEDLLHSGITKKYTEQTWPGKEVILSFQTSVFLWLNVFTSLDGVRARAGRSFRLLP